MEQDKLLDSWIFHGKVGLSSKTMWACIKNLDFSPSLGEIPYDSVDFGRCYNFFKYCNITKEQLNNIAQKLPYWEPFIREWDKLVVMYEDDKEEVGMYENIQQLVNESRKIRQKL